MSHDGGYQATTVDIMSHDGGYRATMVGYHEPRRWGTMSHDGGLS